MARVRVSPDPFTLVNYDAATLAGVVDRVATRVGVDPEVEIAIEVDEALPRPLIASYVDVADGRILLWCSGGNFEHPQYPRRFDDDGSEVKLAVDLLRAADRLSDEFIDAPGDADLTERQREAWDAFAGGRAARLGFAIREPLARYHFRLAHGFGDAVDAVYERIWNAEALTWLQLDALCHETATVDTRSRPKARPGGRTDSLRA